MKANDDNTVDTSQMRPKCKVCDRLIPKPLGEAGDRPVYCQPTMYDHFETFQNFQKSKNQQDNIIKKPFMQLPINSQTDLSESSSQNVLKLSKPLRFGECNLLGKDEETKITPSICKETADGLKLDSSRLLTVRSPMTCPLSDCNQPITGTMMLSHFLRNHNDEYGVQYQEIFLDKPSNLIFDANELDYGTVTCLGILVYGGRKNQRNGYPAERGICKSNAFLPKRFDHFNAHLPVLIMCYRTTWTAMITKGMVKKDEEQSHPKNDLLIIWLATIQTTEDVYGTITLYNKEISTSISSIIKLRCLSSSQNPNEFASEETDFIRLGYYDIHELSHDLTEYIYVEILINEYPAENLQKSHDQHKRKLLYRQKQYNRLMRHKHSIQNWLKSHKNQDLESKSPHPSLSAGTNKQNFISTPASVISQSNRNENAYEKDKIESPDYPVKHGECSDGEGKKKNLKLRFADGGSKCSHDTVSLRKCSKQYRTMIKSRLRRKIQRALAAQRLLKQQRNAESDNSQDIKLQPGCDTKRDNNDKCVETANATDAGHSQQLNKQKQKVRSKVDQHIQDHQSSDTKRHQANCDPTPAVENKATSSCNKKLRKTKRKIKQINQLGENADCNKEDAGKAYSQEANKPREGSKYANQDEDNVTDQAGMLCLLKHKEAALKAELQVLLEKIQAKFSTCEKQRHAMEDIRKLIQQIDKGNDEEKRTEAHHTSPKPCDDKKDFKRSEKVLENRAEYKPNVTHDFHEAGATQKLYDKNSASGKSVDECSLCRRFADDCSLCVCRRKKDDCALLGKWSKQDPKQGKKMNQTNENCERQKSGKKSERKQRIQGVESIESHFRGRRETRLHNDTRSTKRTKSLDINDFAQHVDAPSNNYSQNLKKFQHEIEMNKMMHDKHHDLKHMKPSNLMKADYQALYNENYTKKTKDCNDAVKLKRRNSYDSSHGFHSTKSKNFNPFNEEWQDSEESKDLYKEYATHNENKTGRCVTKDSSPKRILYNPFAKASSVMSKNYTLEASADSQTEDYGQHKLPIGNASDLLIRRKQTELAYCGYDTNTDNSNIYQKNTQNCDSENDWTSANIAYCLEDDVEGDNYYYDDATGPDNIEINSILNTVYENIPELSD